MASETLFEYPDLVVAADGHLYRARACGRPRDDGNWEGWIEFASLDGPTVLRTTRETTQPNRTDCAYWATGLTPVYLEGALRRATEPPPRRVIVTPEPPAYDGPAEAPPIAAASPVMHVDAPLDPFAVYAEGESALRGRLGALATWHLRNIARAYEIVADPLAVEALAKEQLVELIVAAARQASVEPIAVH